VRIHLRHILVLILCVGFALAGWNLWRRRQQYLAMADRHAKAQKLYLFDADLLAKSARKWRDKAAKVHEEYMKNGFGLLPPQDPGLEEIIANTRKGFEGLRAERQKGSDLDQQTAARHERMARTYRWLASHPWVQPPSDERPLPEPGGKLDFPVLPLPEGPVPPPFESGAVGGPS
jgi:hypothetical protein